MAKRHSHPCENYPNCTNEVPCRGEWVRNCDGIPDVICDTFHRPNGTVDAQPCEACEASRCVVCGSVTRVEDHDAECSQVLACEVR